MIKNFHLNISFIDTSINVICIIGIIFFSVNIYNVITFGVSRYNLLKEENRRLQDLRNDEAFLKEQLTWYSSLDFIEAQSRDYLNLANDGDSVIIIPDSFAKDNVPADEQDSFESMSPDIKRWFDLFL